MDFTKTIINAVKIWVNKQLSFIENKISDLENRPSAFIQPEEPSETPDGTLWIDIDEESSDIVKIEIDSELNNTSENPVQNKIINAAINNLNNLIGDTSVAEQITDNIDITLTQSGMAADAKAVGDAINNIPSPLPEVTADNNGDVLTVVDGEWGVGTIEVPVTSVNGMVGDVNIEIPEIPEVLPNPNALTFTGAVDATYDGSNAVAVEIPEQTQADWEQSDSTEKDYVKNRTHYKQVEDSQEILNVLYEASTLSDKYYQSDLPIACEPVLGASYNVWIYGEGTTRGCVLKQYNDTMWYLGNLTVMPYNWYDGDDTGENFLITFRVSNGQLAFGATADICTSTYTTPRGDTSFTVTGPGVIYHQLDKKYLPDDVKDFVSKSYVQSVNGFTPNYDGSIWMAPYETTEEVDIVEGLYTCTDSGRVYGTENKAVYETPVIDVEPVELIVGEMYTVSAETTYGVDGDYKHLNTNPLELKVSSEGHLYIGNPAIAGLPDDVGDQSYMTVGVVFYHVNNVVYGLKYCSNSYILYNNGSHNLTITGPRMKYVQLDEKFIPDTIARVEDIPEQKAITVNGIEPDENGNIEIEVGSGSGGGVSSWNDLTDKPFYEEGGIEVILDNQSVTGSIIDGTSTMHYTMNFGLNLVIGETYTANINGVEFTSTAFESDEEQGAVCIGNPDLLTSPVYPEGEGFALMTSMEANITAFVLRDEGTETATISIYKDSMVVHTLDDKFIPNTIARISDIPNSFSGSYDDLTDKPELFSGSWNDLTDRPIVTTSGEITWDGNTADRDAFSFGGLSYYKIANIPSGKLALTSSTASNGAVLKPGDFSWGTIQHGGAVLYKGNYVFIVESTKIYVSEDNVTEVPSPGIYFGLITYNGQTSYTQAVTYETESIDEKFIPDTIARKSDIPEISDAVIAPTTAQVGQTIVVKSVDENGKPTEWEAVDLLTGADDAAVLAMELGLIKPVYTADDGSIYTDKNGNIYTL